MPKSTVLGGNENAKRYMESAAELRELAAQAPDTEIRDALIKAAEAYERLAEWNVTKPIDREVPD